MSSPWLEFVTAHGAGNSSGDADGVRGFIDPQRSSANAAAFATHPGATRWIAIPADVIEQVHPVGVAPCGDHTCPEVILRLRRDVPAAVALAEALRATRADPRAARRTGAARADARSTGPEFVHGVQRRDLRLVFTRYGSVYDWQLYVEGKEVNQPQSTDKGFVYDLPNHPIDGGLDVAFWIQGINGATGRVAVYVDGADKLLEPPLQAVISNGFGRDNHSYAL